MNAAMLPSTNKAMKTAPRHDIAFMAGVKESENAPRRRHEHEQNNRSDDERTLHIPNDIAREASNGACCILRLHS